MFKMPGCAVATCKNHNTNTKNSDIRYFRFPQNVDLSNQWENSCRRKDKFNLNNARICSIHFEESSFEIPLKHRLLKYNPKNRRILKSDALPSLHLPGSSQKPIHMSDIQVRETKKEHRCLIANLLKRSEMESQLLTSRKHIYHAPHTSVEMKSQPSTSREHIYKARHTTIENIGAEFQLKQCNRQDLTEKDIKTLHKNYRLKNDTQLNSIEEPSKKLPIILESLTLRRILKTFKREGEETLENMDRKDINFADEKSENVNDKQFAKRGPIIFRSKTKQRDVKDEIPELIEFEDTVSKNIEVYIKEEAVDIEENELEPFEAQLLEANLLKGNSDKTIENNEEINKLVIKNNLLMQNFDKLHEENENIKSMFLNFASNIEALSNENKLLKEQMEKTSCSESENAINTEVIDLTDINSICRICLQKNTKLKYLHDSMNFDHPEIRSKSILDTLLSIGLDSISIVEDHLPDKICPKCVELLKQFAIFRYTYSKSCEILKVYAFKINENNEVNSTEDIAFIDETKDSNIKIDETNKKLNSLKYYEVENLKNIQSTEKVEDNSFYGPEHQIKDKKKKHKCPICFKELKLSQFRPHIHKHKGLEIYFSGPKAPKNIKFYAVPNNTVSLVNETEMFHNCPFCPESFTASAYLTHVDNHLKNDQFTCDKCGRVFKKRSYLIQHLLVHTKELPYSCKTCKKGFVNKQNYEYHILTHSYKDDELPYKCEHCDRKFSNPSHLARHMTIHLENCSYSSKYRMKRCRCCLQSFRSEDQFKSHRCMMTGVRVHFCRYCRKSFATSKAYYCHLRLQHKIHKKRNRQFCVECNKVVSNITYHRIRVHPDTASKSLCPVCGLYVVNIYSHRLKHEPLKCNICGKEFRHSTVLKKHVMIHTGQKPFLCSSCPKTFNCKYNLQVHERIHTGDKCHVCSICDKGFLEKSYLKKHMKIHKDIRAAGLKQEYGFDDDDNTYEITGNDDYVLSN